MLDVYFLNLMVWILYPFYFLLLLKFCILGISNLRISVLSLLLKWWDVVSMFRTFCLITDIADMFYCWGFRFLEIRMLACSMFEKKGTIRLLKFRGFVFGLRVCFWTFDFEKLGCLVFEHFKFRTLSFWIGGCRNPRLRHAQLEIQLLPALP